ncbi:MAG: DUF481 domain-containing protein [Pirellulales bacterium]|nr:DUF481 domain-containing protein [Pirellulales bacterium]
MRGFILIRALLAMGLVCGGAGSRGWAQPAELPPPVLPPPSMQILGLVEANVSPKILATTELTESLSIFQPVPLHEPYFGGLKSGELNSDAQNQAVDLSLPTDPGPMSVVPSWYHPAYWFGPPPWGIGFELGINGNQGTNESLSLRAGGHLKRETKAWKLDSSINYNKNTANHVETQNNALFDVRLDRLLDDSPWSLFFLNQNRYDEFQAYDLRVSLNSGVGYQWINTEAIDLIGSYGAGVSREFGAIDERWAYEAFFGVDYQHQFSGTQRFLAEVDYFPEWVDLKTYRVVTDIGWEIDLDRPRNLRLRFSLLNTYDSTPQDVKPNEVNYAALLFWGL